METDTNLLVRLAQVESERDSLRTAQQEAATREVLRAAVGNQFIDSSLAVRLLRDSVKVVDGVVTVIDESGAPRLNSAFEPMSPRELAQELAQEKKFLARGTVLSGVGSSLAQAPANAVNLSEYFGPKSTRAGELHRLSTYDRPRYLAMRRRAQEAGLVR